MTLCSVSRAAIGTVVLTMAGVTAHCQSFEMASGPVNLFIPDNNYSGLATSLMISAGSQAVGSVSVSLNLVGIGSGGFNGDMYVMLYHNGVSSVLLNRAGRTSSSPFGYGDNGISVTFTDNAPNGDIHLYQTMVNPNGGALTGNWSPDGRSVSPFNVTSASPRTAFLSGFGGTSVSGHWSLFLADLSPGGQMELKSWSMSITAVPEPSTEAVWVGTFLFMLRFTEKRANSSQRSFF